ncbi:MAG: DUF58 domain-containing protein [Methanobacteriota archaeon]|nr:MAG: DUF58 domain-containing protein [Euryarchaeota archaeon]
MSEESLTESQMDAIREAEKVLLAKQLKNLSILAQQKVATFLAGTRKSKFRGDGTDFADLRDYVPGDDLRKVDWKATARYKNRLIVKEFEQERNANVVILLDASASMLIGKREPRIKAAVEAIASLTYATIMNKDFIGFAAYSSELSQFIPPKGGKTHEFFIYHKLLTLTPIGETNLGEALKEVSTLLKRQSLILVISDLHDKLDETFRGFRIAKALKHEVQLLQITDYGEFILPDNMGKVKFTDPTTKQPVTIDLSDPLSRGLYDYVIFQKVKEIEDFKRKLRGLKIRVVESHTEDITQQVLLAYYSAKGRA